MQGDVIDFTPEELKTKQECEAAIKKGQGFTERAWDLMIPALNTVRRERLWRDFSSIDEWAERNFGFTKRTLDYYLSSAKNTPLIQAVDPDVKFLPVTFSNLLEKFEEEDRASIWKKAKQEGDISGKSLERAGRSLLDSGDVHLRNGVTLSGRSGKNGFAIDRLKKAWFEIEDEEKAEVIKHIIDNEMESFIMVIKSFAQKRLDELSIEHDTDTDDIL